MFLQVSGRRRFGKLRNGVIDALALLSSPVRFHLQVLELICFGKVRKLSSNVLQALLLQQNNEFDGFDGEIREIIIKVFYYLLQLFCGRLNGCCAVGAC